MNTKQTQQRGASLNVGFDGFDLPQFDVDSELKTLLKNEGINGLLEKDGALRSAISELDAKMKTLVHNNYKKFIIASETINKMNTNIETMEVQLLHLQEVAEKIEKNNHTVTHRLFPKRSEIEELSGVHKLLHQLQFISELPARLEAALASGNYADGIEYYNKISAILDRCASTPSFENIKLKSDQLLEEVKKAVMEKFDDAESTVQNTQKYCLLLRAMNEYGDKLRLRFCQTRSEVLIRLLEKWKNFPISQATPHESKPETYERFIRKLDDDFFPAFIRFVTSYKDIFFSRGDEDEATEDLEPFIIQIFKEYTLTISYHLIHSSSPEVMRFCLKLIGSEVPRYLQDNLVRKIGNISTRSKNVVTDITNHLVNNYYEILVQDFNATVLRLGTRLQEDEANLEPTNDYYMDLILSTLAVSLTSIDQLFEKLSPLLADTAQNVELIEYIMSSMTTSMTAINDHAISLHLSGPQPPTSSYLLTVACVWQHLEKDLSAHFERNIKTLAESRGGTGGVDVMAMSRDQLTAPMRVGDQVMPTQGKNIREWARKFNESIRSTAQQLLSFYVQFEGEMLSPIICKAIGNADWLNRREPRDVDMIIEMLVDEMKQLRNYLQRVFPDDLPAFRPTRSTISGTRGKVNFDRKSVLSAIIRYSFKTFLECVRMVTFGTHGYQQIQVNMTYMKMALIKYSLMTNDDQSSMTILLDEIVNSAEDRTPEAIPMEELIIERICTEKLKKSKD